MWNVRGRRDITYWILLAKPEEARTLQRPRSRWEDVKIVLKETEFWSGLIWLILEIDGGMLRKQY
jgi:hypothetical protein